MKLIVFLAGLFIIVSALYADAPPTGADYYMVKIIRDNDTELIGYLEIYPFYYGSYPANYSLQTVKRGGELLPLVLGNFANKLVNRETLTVYMSLANWRNWNFTVKEGTRQIPVKQIKSIVALQDIGHFNLFEDRGNSRTWVEGSAEIDQNDVSLLRKRVLFSIYGGYKNRNGSVLLLSTNPSYTQLDLYLYTCLMGSADDFLEDTHPYLSNEQVEDLRLAVRNYVYEQTEEKSGNIVSHLKQCSGAWTKLAEYMKQSQSILPEAKSAAINSLQTVADNCKQMLTQLNGLSVSAMKTKSSTEQKKLYNDLINCLLPSFNFPAKLSGEEWKPYLFKRGIICVSLSYLP